MSDSYYRPTDGLKFVMLTIAQERDLFEKARAGDEQAREFIIRNHLLFAAKEGRRRALGKLSEDDVISAANFALMRAYEKFDHTKGNRFSSFLRPFIRGQIVNLWRAQNVVGEHCRKFPEKDEQSGVPQEPVVYQPTEESDHANFLEKMLAEAKQAVLTDKERTILDRHFSEDGEELSRIAKRLKLSRERVRQIKQGALKKLEREMRLRMKLAGIER